MAEGAIVQLWNEWAIQILILLSFAMQIFLFIFAGQRRHGRSDLLMNLLWLGYLMADTTAVYTLGHLSISGSLHEHKLLVFWAPFLLVHLGSQDTITAYSLEDNQLWPRHLLNLVIQAFGVAYVLYKHIADIPARLGLATCLMFIIGVIKYGERIIALNRATLDNLQRSIRGIRPLPKYYHALPPPRGPGAEEHDEEELLLFAQALLPLCMGAMTDSPMLLADNTNISSAYACPIWDKWNWKSMYKLVEMELSLTYDILYTKSFVIHTWYGNCIRFFSPLATIVVFVLFQLSANKDGHNNRVDVAVTYILLVGAFLLDMVSVFTAIISTWTCHFLWDQEWTKLGRVILSLRRHIKAVRVNSRGWSGCVGQFNLLHFCSRDKRMGMRIEKWMGTWMWLGLVDWWNKWHYSKPVVLSEDVKELLFKCVWKVLVEIHDPSAKDEIMSAPLEMILEEPIAMMMPDPITTFYCCPEPYANTAERRMRLAKALDLGAELQEGILAWHICTDVFLLCSDTPKDARSSTYIKAIKAVSNYMVFLITIRPGTIPGLELRSIYEGTLGDLEKTWSYLKDSVDLSFTTREKTLASKLRTNTRQSTIDTHGPSYAKILLELVGSNPAKSCSGIISSYTELDSVAMDKLKRLMPHLELSWRGDGVFNMSKALALILDTWVRLLILASNRCRRDAHARHINCGSELSTIVWLMEEHAGMIFNREPGVLRDIPVIFSVIGEAVV
uniref:Uncharacterized protein n=1 Tax=Avena sativa TaxID=4498 RepID=A0ACD5WCV6_AVESA